MAQYDLYSSRGPATYLLDVQSDLIDGLPTRIVIPLFAKEPSMRRINHLHPTVSIDGRDYVLAMHLVTAVPKTQLELPLGNFLARHDDIVRAVRMLFHGF